MRILFVEIFANVKRFGVLKFIRAYMLQNETKKREKAIEHSSTAGSAVFRIV